MFLLCRVQLSENGIVTVFRGPPLISGQRRANRLLFPSLPTESGRQETEWTRPSSCCNH